MKHISPQKPRSQRLRHLRFAALVAGLFPVTCILLWAVRPVVGDEPESDEVFVELQMARQAEQSLEQRLKLTRERLRLLSELQRARRQLQQLDDQITEAEDRGDDERLEQLEESGHQLDVTIERLESEHGLIEVHVEVLELTVHISADDRPLQSDAQKVLKLLEERRRLTKKLFAAYRNEDDREAGRIEQAAEELADQFRHNLELLELRIELGRARDDGDPEWIAEIEEALREFGEDVDTREEAREEHEGDNDEDERQPRRSRETFDAASAPAPLTLTEAEIARAARLSFRDHVVPLLKSACFSCHDGESASGDLNLEDLIATQPLVKNRSHWVNIIQQLKVRSMPPADAEQPSEGDRRTMTAWLVNAIENFDYNTVRQPGHEPARRLTHDEYNNTVRDLVGLDLRPADRFPTDMAATSGFENSANTLFIQPVTLERYLGAAEAVADAAWPEKITSTDQRQAWQRVLGNGDLPGDADAARRVLGRFCERAWRRAVAHEELDGLVAHFQSRLTNGASARKALRDTLEVILISPDFLIRSEKATPQNARITDWELASRLSYFLWASMPDDELFRLAAAGQLSNPSTLTRQVDRMLNDAKSETLGSIFAAQWLGFNALDRVQRDQIDNPWATDSLVEAMKAESAALFNSLVRDDLPIDRLIDADYTYVNEELAKHYRMKGVRGQGLQRVSLTDSPRRGVLGHGSILAVTSFPGRTSPVVRGNWILSNLLGTPPPPPPPNVSQFDADVEDSEELTQRQKLELHRGNPNCYGCHSQIDPLGFALEEFEWFGRHEPRRDGRRIDTSAKLPGGKTFRGLHELCDALRSERMPELTSQITRKMLSYALGRQLEYYDEATVRDVVATVEQHGRRIRPLVHAIVRSDTFTMNQVP